MEACAILISAPSTMAEVGRGRQKDGMRPNRPSRRALSVGWSKPLLLRHVVTYLLQVKQIVSQHKVGELLDRHRSAPWMDNVLRPVFFW